MSEKNEVRKVIENSISLYKVEDFLKIFFPLSDMGETFTYNGVDHYYLASGGQRNVYVDPNLEYVIKVPHDDLSGFKSNAWEYYAYLEDKHTRLVPSVRTELLEAAPCIIKQDFLVVFNTGRAIINPILQDTFKPEWNNVTEVYGFQYGWNKKTERIEIYDTADELLGHCVTPVEFDKAFSWDVKGFKNLDFVKNLEFKNDFYLKLKEANLFNDYNENYFDYNCQLKHQDGLLVYGYEEKIYICGNVVEQPLYNDIFKKVIEPNYEFEIITD